MLVNYYFVKQCRIFTTRTLHKNKVLYLSERLICFRDVYYFKDKIALASYPKQSHVLFVVDNLKNIQQFKIVVYNKTCDCFG